MTGLLEKKIINKVEIALSLVFRVNASLTGILFR